jgi:phosphatidate cytidylyltransferase
MSFTQTSAFTQRLIVSIILVFILLTAIYYSHNPYTCPFFLLLASILIGGAVLEYYQIAAAKGYKPLRWVGLFGTIAFIAASYFATQETSHLMLPEITVGAILMISFGYYFYTGTSPLINLAITMFGIAYLTIPLSFAIRINYFFPIDGAQDGRIWLLYLLIVTKITDTGAYFSGKKWGKHKLAPAISPNKTWEGALGGLATGVVASLVFASLFPNSMFHLSALNGLWLGAAISIVAQYGDLAESLLKRDGGVKDSSALPGLGGLLDIADSLVFTAPLVYIFLKIQS